MERPARHRSSLTTRRPLTPRLPIWARLEEAVETRTLDLAQKADAFCEASIGGRPARALRLLAETPELATYDFAAHST